MVTLKGTPARLAATLAVTALAVTARWLLKPVLGTELPYVTLFAAVVLAAWHAGTGYALLASALGLVAAQRLFVANAMSGSAEVAGAEQDHDGAGDEIRGGSRSSPSARSRSGDGQRARSRCRRNGCASRSRASATASWRRTSRAASRS